MDNWTVAHYILDKGIETIEGWTDKEIKESIKDIYKKEEELKASGKTSIFQPAWQEDLILTAKKIVTEKRAIKVIAKMIANSNYNEES